MGNTHEISYWREDKVLGWGYETFYAGESFFVAFRKFLSLKRKGCACVKWERRG